MQIKKPMIKFEVPREDQIAPPCVEPLDKPYEKDKPMYSKPMWHNCNNCRTHYASDAPWLRAYVCEKCWKSIPHYRTKKKAVMKSKVEKRFGVRIEKRWRELIDLNWPIEYILLYMLGCSLSLFVITYFVVIDA
jgi:hypothetical protein